MKRLAKVEDPLRELHSSPAEPHIVRLSGIRRAARLNRYLHSHPWRYYRDEELGGLTNQIGDCFKNQQGSGLWARAPLFSIDGNPNYADQNNLAEVVNLERKE